MPIKFPFPRGGLEETLAGNAALAMQKGMPIAEAITAATTQLGNVRKGGITSAQVAEWGSRLRGWLQSVSGQPVPVDPGLQAQQWEAALALQRETVQEQARLREESQADVRRLQEAQLGANPADFVAYELYRRSLEEQGFEPTSPVRSDVDIQDIFSLALGLNEGDTLGAGQFGVNIPTTQSISRSELQTFSPTDIGILQSFLRGGVETDEGFQGINPEDFFTQLEEGLIPTLPAQRTQFRF